MRPNGVHIVAILIVGVWLAFVILLIGTTLYGP
jgi:hypothetical protein